MGSLVVTVLSVTIGLFFILVGTIKLTPIITEDVYKELRKNFIKLVKVFPLVTYTGWKPSPHMYRKVVGVTEIICGLILAFVPGRLKQVANVVLLGVLGFVLYTQYRSGDALEKMTSSLVFGLLLLCRFIVRMQVQSREKKEKEEFEKASAALAKNGQYSAAPSKSANEEVQQPAGNPKDKKTQ